MSGTPLPMTVAWSGPPRVHQPTRSRRRMISAVWIHLSSRSARTAEGQGSEAPPSGRRRSSSEGTWSPLTRARIS